MKSITTFLITMVFFKGGVLSEVSKKVKILKKVNLLPVFGFCGGVRVLEGRS